MHCYLPTTLQLLEYEDKRYSKDLAQIKTEKKELYDQNPKLSKQVAELKSNGYTNDEDDDLPDTAAFKMVLLYRLGFLDRSIWPAATRGQIGRVLGEIIGEKYKTATKYEEHLNNETAKGQTMLENNDEEVEVFLKRSFKDFNLKKQRFIMHLEKKEKKVRVPHKVPPNIVLFKHSITLKWHKFSQAIRMQNSRRFYPSKSKKFLMKSLKTIRQPTKMVAQKKHHVIRRVKKRVVISMCL